jgi:malate dehydrogenase (oxaloacetate-decarboxylating)(NADP+)
MNVPVFHDDQRHCDHLGSGTGQRARIGRQKNRRGQSRGERRAGASGVAPSTTSASAWRARHHHVDTKGVVYKGREERMNPYKERFAHETTNRTLADAAKGADVLSGLSVKGALHS